ncbi:MAG: DUF885 domain-containing protein [Candidatus Hodarchaeales archaeon]|jgi:hypothetical protein
MALLDDINEIIERWKYANPGSCHNLGIHEYDGEIRIPEDLWIEKRVNEIIDDLNLIKSLQSNYVDKIFEKFELRLVQLTLERELFELRDRKEFKENPLAFIGPLTVTEGSFTKRSFASIEDRIDLIIKYENNFPDLLSSATTILDESLPRIKIMLSLDFLKGIVNFYKNDLSEFINKSSRSEIIDQWREVNSNAIEAMEKFSEKLQKEYLPKAHDNFALGEEKYLELLQKQEAFETDLETLLKVGEEDLERNYQAMKSLLDKQGTDFLDKVMSDGPDLDKIFDYATSTLDRARQFVIDSGIASVPTDEQCKVIPTPEYIRAFAFAAMNTPGPFEVPEASEAYYYVTPPDENWPEPVKENFMKFFNKSFFESVTIHEAWPGHYLQLLFNKQSKSTISKFFARSTSMIEGWAHYAEEMVQENKYAELTKLDPLKLKVGQLLGALMRNCRFVASVKMHCYGMKIDEAKKLFQEKGFMPERNAEIEARRGTIDPMYLNYTLGKLLIKKLREDYKKEKGSEYSLRR